MINKYGIKALSDNKYDYYELVKDFGELKSGAIFVHDPDDTLYGSVANGCLKLCWDIDGNTYSGLSANTVFLHYSFSKDKSLFRKLYTSYNKKLEDEIYEGIKNLESQIQSLKSKLKSRF